MPTLRAPAFVAVRLHLMLKFVSDRRDGVAGGSVGSWTVATLLQQSA